MDKKYISYYLAEPQMQQLFNLPSKRALVAPQYIDKAKMLITELSEKINMSCDDSDRQTMDTVCKSYVNQKIITDVLDELKIPYCATFFIMDDGRDNGFDKEQKLQILEELCNSYKTLQSWINDYREENMRKLRGN